jgi:hypothetical protein
MGYRLPNFLLVTLAVRVAFERDNENRDSESRCLIF